MGAAGLSVCCSLSHVYTLTVTHKQTNTDVAWTPAQQLIALVSLLLFEVNSRRCHWKCEAVLTHECSIFIRCWPSGSKPEVASVDTCLLTLFTVHLDFFVRTRNILDDFREAYYWLRQNTDEHARVMSWWDYGYQIAGMANRTTLVDNNTWNNSHIALVRPLFLSCQVFWCSSSFADRMTVRRSEWLAGASVKSFT